MKVLLNDKTYTIYRAKEGNKTILKAISEDDEIINVTSILKKNGTIEEISEDTETQIIDLKDALKEAETNLTKDINNFEYIRQKYFESKPTKDTLYTQYSEIANKLETLLKSMLYNVEGMRANLK